MVVRKLCVFNFFRKKLTWDNNTVNDSRYDADTKCHSNQWQDDEEEHNGSETKTVNAIQKFRNVSFSRVTLATPTTDFHAENVF